MFGAMSKPYGAAVVEANKQRLHRSMINAWNSGQSLKAYQTLLIALQLDPVSPASDPHPLTDHALPTLHRVLHSNAARVGYVRV